MEGRHGAIHDRTLRAAIIEAIVSKDPGVAMYRFAEHIAAGEMDELNRDRRPSNRANLFGPKPLRCRLRTIEVSLLSYASQGVVVRRTA